MNTTATSSTITSNVTNNVNVKNWKNLGQTLQKINLNIEIIL